MKKIFLLILILFLFACSSDTGGENPMSPWGRETHRFCILMGDYGGRELGGLENPQNARVFVFLDSRPDGAINEEITYQESIFETPAKITYRDGTTQEAFNSMSIESTDPLVFHHVYTYEKEEDYPLENAVFLIWVVENIDADHWTETYQAYLRIATNKASVELTKDDSSGASYKLSHYFIRNKDKGSLVGWSHAPFWNY